jgi:hypothetical protein
VCTTSLFHARTELGLGKLSEWVTPCWFKSQPLPRGLYVWGLPASHTRPPLRWKLRQEGTHLSAQVEELRFELGTMGVYPVCRQLAVAPKGLPTPSPENRLWGPPSPPGRSPPHLQPPPTPTFPSNKDFSTNAITGTSSSECPPVPGPRVTRSARPLCSVTGCQSVLVSDDLEFLRKSAQVFPRRSRGLGFFSASWWGD